MNPVLKNVLAIVAGFLAGGVVNMALIMLGPTLIPIPEGVDVTSPESLKASMHLFEPKHFLFPFLAHALGTLAGAWLTTRLAATRHQFLALFLGAFFLAGGIVNVVDLPAPAWFESVDLILAYLPMAWLGYRLARRS